MRVAVKQGIQFIVIGVIFSAFIASSIVRTIADTSELSDKRFLIYQLQTGSPTSTSSELISIVNVSNKPQRLDGLCLFYSAATSDTWFQRACFSGPDAYTQLWIVSGGSAYMSNEMFVIENPGFIPDAMLSSSMAASGGAVKIEQDNTELDLLGWGTSNFREGNPAAAPNSSELLQRSSDGVKLIDSEDNSVDFGVYPQGITAQSGVFEVTIPRDVCSNIDGLQEEVPIGYEAEDNECYQDVCLNIEGLQKSAENYVVDPVGVCTEVQREDAVLLITELLPNVSGTDDGKEFIELYNPNDRVIPLEGYKVKVDSKQYILSGGELLPGRYVALSDTTTGITLPNTSGVEVVLEAPSGREVSSSEVYTNAPDDYAWIVFSGQWQFSNQPTPGEENKISVSDSVGGESEENELAPCPEGKFRNPLTNRCKTIESSTSLVPCEADEFRNPLTNRCNKIQSSSSSLAPCGPGQERNPATNRCRKIPTDTALEPCPEGKERNPETNRCRTVAVLASADTGSGPALTATIVDVPAPSTGVNWAIISAAILGSLGYILYEWRMELKKAVASLRSYRYN